MTMMTILLLAMMFATCEFQSTAKGSSQQTGSRCFIDDAMQEELEILKKELLSTNAILEAMEKTQQSQLGKVS